MTAQSEWSRAFALQARADLQTYQYLLKNRELPVCQSLHALQMACEKLAKAHLLAKGESLAGVTRSHNKASKALPLAFRENYITHEQKQLHDKSQLLRSVKHYCQEIDKLHPSVDENARPDNCEYPWPDHAGNVIVPAQYTGFDIARKLRDEPVGAQFLKFVETKINELVAAPVE